MPLATPAPLFSGDEINPNENFSNAHRTTNVEAFGLTLARGAFSSLNGIGNTANALYAKYVAPGKTYSKDEWEESGWFREGLRYDDLKGDNEAISQYTAELAARNKDEKDALELRLKNMRPGFLAGASKFAGDTVGFFLDPASIVGGSIGFKAAKILKNAKYIRAGLESTTRGIRTAVGAGVGAVEAGVAVSVPATIEFSGEKELGDENASLRLIANIGLGMGLGGAVRGFGEFRRLIHPESDVAATQVAASQLESGKAVRTDEIIKDGLYRQSVVENNESQAARSATYVDDDARALLQERLGTNVKTKLETDIHNIESDIKNQAVNIKTRTGFVEPSKTTNAKNILSRLEKINRTEKLDRGAQDNVFLSQGFKTEELQKARDILQKPGFERNADEIMHLKTLTREGGEEKLIRERLEVQEGKVAELEEKLKRADKEKAAQYQKELKIIKDSQELGKLRINQLKSGFSDKVLADKSIALEEKKAQLKAVDEVLTTDDALKLFDNMDKPPVEPNELMRAAQAVRDYKNSASYFERDVQALENEVNAVPKTDDEVLKKAADDFDLLADSELSEEERAYIDEIKTDSERIADLGETLPDVINCLLR